MNEHVRRLKEMIEIDGYIRWSADVIPTSQHVALEIHGLIRAYEALEDVVGELRRKKERDLHSFSDELVQHVENETRMRDVLAEAERAVDAMREELERLRSERGDLLALLRDTVLFALENNAQEPTRTANQALQIVRDVIAKMEKS